MIVALTTENLKNLSDVFVVGSFRNAFKNDCRATEEIANLQ